jgi:transketolase
MRNKFIEKLVIEAEKDDSIILIVGDLGFNVIEPFSEKFPDRFFNAGICEQSMASMAAGMASEGHKVFIYSIANFPTFRCAEQIRNDICYHNLDVTIVSVGGGLAYGNLGYSHHAIQDYGLMRLFPEISILSPGDPIEVDKLFAYILNDSSPKYLRLRKAGEKNYSNKNGNISAGKWSKIKYGNSIFLTTGYGLEIAQRLIKGNEKFSNFGIYTCPIWGPKYNKLQEDQINQFDVVISVEDHMKDCGFGSWLNESCKSNNVKNKLYNSYLDKSVIGKVGSEDFLLENFKIDY